MTATADQLWEQFHTQVIKPGNCLHCGACAGLLPKKVRFVETPRGPLPEQTTAFTQSDTTPLRQAWAVCPGRGVPYSSLFKHLKRSPHPLLGPYRDIYVGHSGNKTIRKKGASGGTLSTVLIHLLETKRIKAAIVLQQGLQQPELATPTLARSAKEVLAASQSVYAVTPMLTILADLDPKGGPYAFVGLPEQVAALRMLQAAGNKRALAIKYILGPYTGTNMYHGAVRAFLRGQGVANDVAIKRLQWRAGDWPGHLQIDTKDGQTFKAEKFYYNYLIPFFISRNCQIIPDFANELTDLSVGDAWAPTYERQGGGHAVIVPRSSEMANVIEEMAAQGKLTLDPVSLEKALSMHGHMLDFKKRGTFIRLNWQAKLGKPVPQYDYYARHIGLARVMVEGVLALIFTIGRQPWARWLITHLPLGVVGPAFNYLRLAWKGLSKPTKRKGLTSLMLAHRPQPQRWQEITGA